MASVSIGQGVATLDEGADFTWEPGPPVNVDWAGPDSALPVLAAAACATRDGHVDPDPARPARVDVSARGTQRTVVVNGSPGKPGLVVVETKPPETVRDRLMVQLVAMSIGVPPQGVMAAGAQPRIIDVGVPTLVVPVQDEAHLEGLTVGDLSRAAPEAEAVAAYVVTQQRPYAKATLRVVPEGVAHEPFVWAAVPVHALSAGVMRADYPVTRFVLSEPGSGSRLECRCHLEKGGTGPKFVHVRVGGEASFE